jgi:uncharacterized protein (TIGR02231 family)
MKKFALFLVFFCLIKVLNAQLSKNINSVIKDVTLFTSGAQVNRVANVNLQAGTTELIFEGISPNINSGSIQSSGRGNFIILDTRYNIKYQEPSDEPESNVPESLQRRINLTQDTLNDVNYELEAIKDRKDVFAKQKEMINNNPLMKGGGKSDSLPVLKDVIEFYNQKMTSINAELQKIKKEEARVLLKRTNIQNRLNALLEYKNRIISSKTNSNNPVHQIIVTVSAKEPANGSLSLSYMVSNCGWSPLYDIRVNNTEEPVELTMKANVYQNTGEEWKSVNLKLSTHSFGKGNIKPVLYPWYLSYYMPVSVYTSNLSMPRSEGTPKTKQGNVSYDAEISASQTIADFSTSKQNITGLEYSIEIPYSLPTDGKNYLLVIKNEKIKSQYKYFSVPKIYKDVFLAARLTGWDDLNLLEAKSNIYFEGTYIGETFINPSVLADTLEISLGRDKNVIVQRKKLKDKEKEQIVGNSIVKTVTMEISIRNNKNSSVELTVEDQIPVTNEKDIKITFIGDNFNGIYNENTGMLKWNINLKPKENRVLTFSYSIKYDKDKRLIF